MYADLQHVNRLLDEGGDFHAIDSLKKRCFPAMTLDLSRTRSSLSIRRAVPPRRKPTGQWSHGEYDKYHQNGNAWPNQLETMWFVTRIGILATPYHAPVTFLRPGSCNDCLYRASCLQLSKP
jgi:hypothetical protein